jgi:predicted TPR repeat methyltransferase
MALRRSSGDLNADRRYEYARASLEDCDGAAAADLFRQVLELVPDWPPAHFGLGEALTFENDRDGAVAAFRRTLELAPDDVLGASLRLAWLGAAPPDAAMRPAFVAQLFDDYADTFDDHLVIALAYRAPEIIADALARVCAARGRPARFGSALDLGCGTGLMAKALGGMAMTVDGVDLSPRMAAKARATGLYRQVQVGDVVEALRSPFARGGSYHLLLAADVLVYIGDLTQLLRAAHEALDAQGLFAFTFQFRSEPGYGVGADLRHHHSEAYVRETAASAGLGVALAEPCAPRNESGFPVAGMVMVVERPGG